MTIFQLVKQCLVACRWAIFELILILPFTLFRLLNNKIDLQVTQVSYTCV